MDLGVPGEYPLDDATLEQVGVALGEYVVLHSHVDGNSPRVLIGRDTRESGPHIADRIAWGLSAAGAEPVSAGVDHSWSCVAGEPRVLCRRRSDIGFAQSVP